jgi:hypothetical protein
LLGFIVQSSKSPFFSRSLSEGGVGNALGKLQLTDQQETDQSAIHLNWKFCKSMLYFVKRVFTTEFCSGQVIKKIDKLFAFIVTVVTVNEFERQCAIKKERVLNSIS